MHKYHSGGLWTNTCCSHQREGEGNLQAGKRRLKEEMGFTTPLEELFSFIYKAPFDNGLTEHEFDHVMLGYYDGLPKINFALQSDLLISLYTTVFKFKKERVLEVSQPSLSCT